MGRGTKFWGSHCRVSRGGFFKGDKACLKTDGEGQLQALVEVMVGVSSLYPALSARGLGCRALSASPFTNLHFP